MTTRPSLALLTAFLALARLSSPALPTVEIEEEVYRFENANNGAGPMWCAGSTCIARVGDTVYATGLETIPSAKPLNNCRWVLWRRNSSGWTRLYVDETGRTREPAPLASLANGDVFVSANPTLIRPDQEGGGAARPEVVRFAAGGPSTPTTLAPRWNGEPEFTEHSYRSFAADRGAGELILFQNIDHTHAEWTFRDAQGNWSAQGQLKWPWGADYPKPESVRICYPNVALVGRAVYFFGVSDIVEPNPEWRAFKRDLTGQAWDYEFRRLFYTWTPDVTREPFREWIEIASREKTCGWLWPCDLNVAGDGTVRILWTERAIDERLRAKFFPEARQSHTLNLGVIRGGKLVSRQTLLQSTEDQPGRIASAARFQGTLDGRLLVLRHVSGAGASGNESVELDAEGKPARVDSLGFAKPFTSYFTATPRAGSASGDVIDVLGIRAGTENAVSYARVRFR